MALDAVAAGVTYLVDGDGAHVTAFAQVWLDNEPTADWPAVGAQTDGTWIFDLNWSETTGSEREIWAVVKVARATKICGTGAVPSQVTVVYEPYP